MVKYGKIESMTEDRRSPTSSSDSSVSSSDSEYYSPEEIVAKNAKHHRVGRSPKVKKQSKFHKMRMSDVPVGGDSPSTSNENNEAVALDMADYTAAMEKNQQLEKLVTDLTRERQGMLRLFIDEMKVFFEDGKNLVDTSVEEVDFFALMNEVKREAMGLRFQLDTTDKENQEMKEYIRECNANTARRGEENAALRARVDELEKLPQPDDTEALQSKLDELVGQVKDLQHQNEKLKEETVQAKSDEEERHVLETRVDELVRDVSVLEMQNKKLAESMKLYEENSKSSCILESKIGDLQDKNKKLEEEIVSSKKEKEALVDQMGAMQQEMEAVIRKKRELIEQINTIQVERLNDEKSRSREDERRVLESNMMLQNLETQIDSSNKQKREMEVILKESSEENCLLKEKIKEVEEKIYDLERNLAQRSDRVSELEREASELSTRLSLRDEEFYSLQSQKAQLELKIARGREEEANVMKNNALAKEREEKVNNGISSKEYEKIRGWFKGSKPSLQVIERKMEELVEEFRKHMEDNIRLMSQRIRVTEQLHAENKESYKITKERLEQENRILETRTCEYSRILSTLDTATTRLKNVADATNNMLLGLDLVCKQFDERNGRMMNRMSKFSEELRYVKNWVVGTKKVNELLKGEMGVLVEQLQRKEENESLLREKISILLESKSSENVSMVKGLEHVEQKMRGLQRMVKEKENGILDICEEKREAIRQLCVLIDYQKNRSDYFKQIIIEKINVTSPRKC